MPRRVAATTSRRARTRADTPRTVSVWRRIATWFDGGRRGAVRVLAGWLQRYRNFMSRRPHRSFRRTRRRDVPLLTPLPSNIFFTSEVIGVMRRYRRDYVWFIVIYVVVFTVIAGLINQDDYTAFGNTLSSAGTQVLGGDIGKTAEIAASFMAIVSGQLSGSLGESQQIYVTLLSVLTWMTIVWFLRHRLSGAAVTVRDAIYNAGSPLVPTLVVTFVGLFQLVPGAVGVLVYGAAMSTGIVQGGVEAMIFAVAALLLVVLSLYWVTSTLFALVIVTIPGTYPFRALSMAGDVVIGRRVSMLVRLLWLVLSMLAVWVAVLVPTILLADALPWKWLPLVPVIVQLLAGFSIVFAATYIYVLYRRMIDAAPKSRSKKAL